MKRDFDFDRLGKRLPYTAPDGFLDDMENNVWETVRQEMLPSKPQRHFRLWYSLTGGLVAASIALLVVFNLLPDNSRSDFEDVEKAFANLSSSDQDYLFATYQDDLFMKFRTSKKIKRHEEYH